MSLQEVILIVAPIGQDAPLASQFLGRHGIRTEIIADVPALIERLDEPAAGIIIAEEAITRQNSRALKNKLFEQEKWSDLPLLLLTSQKEHLYRAKEILEFFSVGGNISLLERPFRGVAFLSSVQVALRSRRKQYEVRDLLRDQAKAVRIRDEFLSLASHELKTPLTSIKLQVQMRQRSIDRGDESVYSPEKVQAMIAATGKQVDRLTRLVDDMLDVAKIENGKLDLQLDRFDLGDLVQQVFESFQSQFENARVPVTLHREGVCVGAWDRHRLEQVVVNLFTNAIKYGEGKPVEIVTRAADSRAILTVHDHGQGISHADQLRVFQRFERASLDANISGLGLGLYITRQILEMHGGRIWIESVVGKGSSFVVELPM